MGVTHIHHDKMCPACDRGDCSTCECLCDLIADVREDERATIKQFWRPKHVLGGMSDLTIPDEEEFCASLSEAQQQS